MPNSNRKIIKESDSDSPLKSSGCLERNSVDKSAARTKSRKRKRHIDTSSDSEPDLDGVDCNLEDAINLEKKLRKIARYNSLTDEEMRKLLQKFMKNEHILALVTLKAEDELAREKQEAKQKAALIITESPSVPKLTRARARELNRTPVIALPSLIDQTPPEISALIEDELHSDEDDEEYTFKEDDFVSDDDPNTTASDMDSNPRTPGTPHAVKTTPLKISEDGCFKVPPDKQDDLRIATRTRSKFCLQQTTIEDLESEFIPPDLEYCDVQDASELTVNDEDWMQFLNDFSKPLNNTVTGDDDDPVNDPEYVATEKIPVDYEELRDANISKRELTDLVSELFEGLINEGVSVESIELETPQKFISNNKDTNDYEKGETPATPISSTGKSIESRSAFSRQLDFDNAQKDTSGNVCDATISSTNLAKSDCNFQPNAISTPSNHAVISIAAPLSQEATQIMLEVPEGVLTVEPELIAVPIAGQPNCYQLAKIIPKATELVPEEKAESIESTDTRYSLPYDTNYTWKYISIKKHLYSEYINQFEKLKDCTDDSTSSKVDFCNQSSGFTQHQHDLLQQQLCIHVQLLTQKFLQTYCHPDLWKWAGEPYKLLMELKERAKTDASFNAWNLNAAVDLVTKWKDDCSVDNEENRAMMEFLNNEALRTNRNTRQIARFPPRIMDLMLNSTVFLYPEYLPRVPFTKKQKEKKYDVFAPAESHLLALGLEKHMINGRNAQNKPLTLRRACERISRDMIYGKTPRRIWDRIKILRNAEYYNPVKYFFEHGRPPPIECKLHTFPGNKILPPKERISELPLAWQKYLNEKQDRSPKTVIASPVAAAEKSQTSYYAFVKEVLGEDIQLPDGFVEAAEPEQAQISIDAKEAFVNSKSSKSVKASGKSLKQKLKHKKNQPVVINVNYVFGPEIPSNIVQCDQRPFFKHNSSEYNVNKPEVDAAANVNNPGATNYYTDHGNVSNSIDKQLPVIAFNYDVNSNTLVPLTEPVKEPAPGPAIDKTQRRLTDYYSLIKRKEASEDSNSWEDIENGDNEECAVKNKIKTENAHSHITPLNKRRTHFRAKRRLRQLITQKYRRSRKIRKRCTELLTTYLLYLETQERCFRNKPLLQYFFKHFKALDLYTGLLYDLKMNCKNLGTQLNGSTTVATNMQSLGKRNRSTAAGKQNTEEADNNSRSKKSNRQEENFRNMLLPDSAEDANRKDAIYAFNFYEKVEEMFKKSNRPEDFKRFNYILKNFDPKRDRASDLYYKLEGLFLPDFPELAEVFLTFLLPSEAAKTGKFFEHFMATNMNTFINKLNIYFRKQPAQIRKVYTCLNELAEEENVTVKSIEAKILPLLKGNEFLIDWFMQLFPTMPPPERLFSTPEHVNLKELQNYQGGEYTDTLIDSIDSSNQDQHQQQQQQHCQLRYINGRIFYGSKITLPAKLSFMAQQYTDEIEKESSDTISSHAGDEKQQAQQCIHAIREHGEERLAAAVAAAATVTPANNSATFTTTEGSASDDNDKSEDNEMSIVTTGEIVDEQISSTTFKACDETALRAHAIRLNPHYYGTPCYTQATTITTVSSSNQTNAGHSGNISATQQMLHSNTKRTGGLYNSEDNRMSPRKAAITEKGASVGSLGSHKVSNVGCGSTTTSTISQLASHSSATTPPSQTLSREKRKSPIKKINTFQNTNSTNSISSPKFSSASKEHNHEYNRQPMVVIHERNPAIACAKKLKSLIEFNSESDGDTKEAIQIVAKEKYPVPVSSVSPSTSIPKTYQSNIQIKLESDDMEFLPEDSDITPILTQSSHTQMDELKSMEADGEEELPQSHLPQPETACSQAPATIATTSHIESDEDCKLDIVANLANEQIENDIANDTEKQNRKANEVGYSSSSMIMPWTRDEDKVVLIEMKLGSRNQQDLFERIKSKLPERSFNEIRERHQFLIDFLSKLQGN